MHFIQNSSITSPACQRIFAKGTCGLAITAMALAIIGLTASTGGPFNAIATFGQVANGAILGTSIFVLILDLVWMSSFKEYKQSADSTEERADALNVQTLFPQTLFPSLKIFDEGDFWIYFHNYFNKSTELAIDGSDLPPLDHTKIISTLQEYCSSIPNEDRPPKFILLTFPKGLTYNMLDKIAQNMHPKALNFSLSMLAPYFNDQQKETGIDQSCRVLFAFKQHLSGDLSGNQRWPAPLEAAAFAIINHWVNPGMVFRECKAFSTGSTCIFYSDQPEECKHYQLPIVLGIF